MNPVKDKNRWHGMIVGMLVVPLAACTQPDPAGPFLGTSAVPAAAATSALRIYGIGSLERTLPASPCAGGASRDFDFWIGSWSVVNDAGDALGTDRVESILDGCAVFEQWTSVTGSRVRTLSAWDADLGIWRQTWVSARPIGDIRMAGAFQGGTMDMRGERVSPGGFSILDHYTWREIAPDVVEQRGTRDIPVINFHFSLTAFFHRVDAIDPAPEVQSTDCQVGGSAAASRQADFLAGSWNVAAQNGPTVGMSDITVDLSGCLFAEQFRSSGGLQAESYLYYDPIDRAWHRTYVDSEGQWIEFIGRITDGVLVLQGTEPREDGRSADLRLSLAPHGTDRILQTVEVSSPSGARWVTAATLVFTRS